MKKETLKHIETINYILNAENDLNEYRKQLLDEVTAIMRIETSSGTKKFSFWDYVVKNEPRPSMQCIMHDSGYKVASDGHLLVAIKEDYPEEYEGKMLKPDGTFLDDCRYPNWRYVIPDADKTGYYELSKIDFDRTEEIFKEIKGKSKLNKEMNYFIKVANEYFIWDLFRLYVKAMRRINTNEIYTDKEGMKCAVSMNGDDRIVITPVRYDDGLETVEVYEL